MKILLNTNNEVKNVEEYINEFLEAQDLTEYDIFYKTEENEKKVLKSQTSTVTIVLKKDILPVQLRNYLT